MLGTSITLFKYLYFLQLVNVGILPVWNFAGPSQKFRELGNKALLQRRYKNPQIFNALENSKRYYPAV